MLRAFLIAVAGIGLLTCMDALIKGQTEHYSTVQVTLMRFMVGSAASAVLVGTMRVPLPSLAGLGANVWRTAFAVFAALAFYYGIARIPLAEAMALWLLAPCLTALAGALILHERVTARVMAALGFGLLGMLLIVAPKFGGLAASSTYAQGVAAIVVAMASYSLSLVLLRSRATVDHPLAIVAIHNVGATAMIAALLPFAPAGTWVMPDATTALASLAVGVLGVAGHLMVARAYGRAPANVLASSEYSGLLFASVIGYLFFAEVPAWTTFAGAALIVAASLAASRG